MLIPWRRYFAIPAFFLLATPLAVGIVRPDGPAAVLKEGRFLSPPPRMPESGAAWLKLPKEVDAYLSDHFGLRDALIRAHKDLTKPMLGFGNDSVLVGRDGRLFYLGEDTVRQSAGLILRDERVSDTVALLARMNAALKARGIRFLVAVPPNAPTICRAGLRIAAGERNMTCSSTGLRRRASRRSISARWSGKPALKEPLTTCTIPIGPRGERSPRSTPSPRRTGIPTGGSIRPRR